MKNTDKVTLTVEQLKKLIKESKYLNEAKYDDFNNLPTRSYSSLMRQLGSFDHIQLFDKNMLQLWFLNGVIYCPTIGSLRGLPAAISIDNDRLYFNVQPEYFDSLDQAIAFFKKYNSKVLDSYIKENAIGVMKFGNNF